MPEMIVDWVLSKKAPQPYLRFYAQVVILEAVGPSMRGKFPLKYFDVSTNAQGAVLDFVNLQMRLSVAARFVVLASLIPSPPLEMGWVTMFQLTRWSFFFEGELPQRKLLCN